LIPRDPLGWLVFLFVTIYVGYRLDLAARRRAEAREQERRLEEESRLASEAQERKARILTAGFLAAQLRSSQDATLESAHRAFRSVNTPQEYEALAKESGLHDFASYDPYLVEIEWSDDPEDVNFYQWELNGVNYELLSLLKKHGSSALLREFTLPAG